MNSKDKANLSYLYELEQYKSFTRFCKSLRLTIAEQLLAYDLTAPNAERHVAFLQGQAFALDSLQKKLKELHRKSMNEV